MAYKPSPVVPNVPVVTDSKKLYLSCGLNDYPGTKNDLNGCVNDALDWTDLLHREYRFNVTRLTNYEVGKSNVVNALKDMVAKASEGWHLVWSFSGHGSNVADKDGDEPDKRDECLCLHDSFLLDDEIRAILKNLHPKASFTFISDSCHSGSVTRAFMSTLNIDAPYAKPRFLPPEDNNEALVIPGSMARIMNPEEGMNEILISGCSPTEYSYDAYIGGRYNGAMTYNAVRILKQTPNITYNAFYAQLRKVLPSSNYPQTPQLEGKEENKNKLMFS